MSLMLTRRSSCCCCCCARRRGPSRGGARLHVALLRRRDLQRHLHAQRAQIRGCRGAARRPCLGSAETREPVEENQRAGGWRG